ncbi:hypothetical protein H5410_005791, partial [Solanum commersonii]
GAKSYALVLVFFLSRYMFAILYGDLPMPQNHLICPQHNHVGDPLEHGFPPGEKSITPTSAPV